MLSHPYVVTYVHEQDGFRTRIEVGWDSREQARAHQKTLIEIGQFTEIRLTEGRQYCLDLDGHSAGLDEPVVALHDEH